MSKLAIDGGKPIRNSILYLAEPVIGDEEISAVETVLRSGWIREGEKVKAFEREVSEYIGTKYAIAVSSGTAALHTACAACKFNKGSEIIVPSFTHISTTNAVLYIGATPIFAEIDPITLTLDPNDVEDKITENTKAIIPVHWAGHPANMNALRDIADRHDLLIIEDSCQAMGSKYFSEKIGSMGTASCFSFFPSKIITTGEGGMITTDDKQIYDYATRFRNYGQSWENRFYHTILGYNYRMSEIQAAIGLSQMNRIENIIKIKNNIAKKISEQLKSVAGICCPKINDEIRHTFMHYTIKIDEKKFGISRDYLVESLNHENIESRAYIPPVHLQPYYKNLLNTHEGLLPITEDIAKKVLTLPCSPRMTNRDIKDIVEAINKIKNN